MKYSNMNPEVKRSLPLTLSNTLVRMVADFKGEQSIDDMFDRWVAFAEWANKGKARGAGRKLGLKYQASGETWSRRYVPALHYVSPQGKLERRKLKLVRDILEAREVGLLEFYKTVAKYLTLPESNITRSMEGRTGWPEGLEDALETLLGIDFSSLLEVAHKEKKNQAKKRKVKKHKVATKSKADKTQQPKGLFCSSLGFDKEQFPADLMDLIDRLNSAAHTPLQDQINVLFALMSGETIADVIVNRRWVSWHRG